MFIEEKKWRENLKKNGKREANSVENIMLILNIDQIDERIWLSCDKHE